MGVDLFFVLSGYLIGLQLLRPLATGKPLQLSTFYLRRAYRILPAYLVVLLLYLYLPIWREHEGLPAPWKLLTLTANLRMNFPVESAFSHVWSLCVEEHFYLLLPGIIMWQLRRPAAWKACAFCLLAVLAGLVLRGLLLFHVVHASGVSEEQARLLFMTRIYYPTYCRLDGLISGVALASVQTFRPRWWSKVSARGNGLLFLGLLLTGTAVWTFQGAYPSPDVPAGVLFGFPLLALGFGSLVAAASSSNGWLRARIPGAELLATLAFSLYLTHKEVAHLDQALMPWLADETGWRAAAIYTATCLSASALLYLCVERPFLTLRNRSLRTPVSVLPTIEAHLNPSLSSERLSG